MSGKWPNLEESVKYSRMKARKQLALYWDQGLDVSQERLNACSDSDVSTSSLRNLDFHLDRAVSESSV